MWVTAGGSGKLEAKGFNQGDHVGEADILRTCQNLLQQSSLVHLGHFRQNDYMNVVDYYWCVPYPSRHFVSGA